MARLLVVEDNKNQRMLYTEELEDKGYKVIAVGTAREALEAVQEGGIDLVVLDIQMPGIDGVEALGKILSKKSQLPVILYTDYSDRRENFLTWSADAYMVKSSDITPLVNEIKKILGGTQPVSESAAVTSGSTY